MWPLTLGQQGEKGLVHTWQNSHMPSALRLCLQGFAMAIKGFTSAAVKLGPSPPDMMQRTMYQTHMQEVMSSPLS